MVINRGFQAFILSPYSRRFFHSSASEMTYSTPSANETIESHMTHPGSTVKLPLLHGPVPMDNEKVFFFDIDNCLYHASYKIHDLMQVYIRRYISKHLNVSAEEAKEINVRYYKDYGLAIQGLVNFHKIDAMEYNKEVDDALPLHEILEPDMKLREMLLNLRASKKVGRLWLFTNAYKTHGMRVIRLLGLGDLFDGMTFCDYEKQLEFICKPDPRIFRKALHDAGVSDPRNAYFVDDSAKNCKTAIDLGFREVVNVIEDESKIQDVPEGCKHIYTVHDLPKVLPELWNQN